MVSGILPGAANDSKKTYMQNAKTDFSAQACPSFNKLSAEEKQKALKSQTIDLFCRLAFFKDHPIAPPAQTLPSASFTIYQNHLENNRCRDSEQILWQHYLKRYPKAPAIYSQKAHFLLRSHWEYDILLLKAPETFFCIVKETLVKNEKIITQKELPTNPINDLKNLNRHVWSSEPEAKRVRAINNLLALVNEDFTKAQLYLVKLAYDDKLIELTPALRFLLLERLKYKKKLPTKWKLRLEQARQDIPNDKLKFLTRDAHYSFFNFPY